MYAHGRVVWARLATEDAIVRLSSIVARTREFILPIRTSGHSVRRARELGAVMAKIMKKADADYFRVLGWAVDHRRLYATCGSRTVSLRRHGKRRLWGWSCPSASMNGFETATAAYVAGELQGWKPLDVSS